MGLWLRRRSSGRSRSAEEALGRARGEMPKGKILKSRIASPIRSSRDPDPPDEYSVLALPNLNGD